MSWFSQFKNFLTRFYCFKTVKTINVEDQILIDNHAVSDFFKSYVLQLIELINDQTKKT